jgi:hypothetical protein
MSKIDKDVKDAFLRFLETLDSTEEAEAVLKKSVAYELKTGKNYLFRTITMIYTGRLHQIEGDHYVLLNAAWIPETNRWSESVRTGQFKEVEPYPPEEPVFLFKGAILDIVAIPVLPLEVK